MGLEEALGAAVRAGLLVLADRNVAGCARIEKRVLRYDADADEASVAAAVEREVQKLRTPHRVD